jgi:predicted metal-dependent hydrolase
MNSIATKPLKYLLGYSSDTQAQVAQLVSSKRLGEWLQKKYPSAHGIRTDKALYDYVQDLKQTYLRGAEPLAKVAFDSKLQVVQHALGTHTTVSRVQGSRLKAKREIRIAALFKDVPDEFLKMITVHELAHLKERDHDKAFYKLCAYMEPQYHQIEFELRMYLTHLDESGGRLWE